MHWLLLVRTCSDRSHHDGEYEHPANQHLAFKNQQINPEVSSQLEYERDKIKKQMLNKC